ncbi:hypothetical protein GON09_004933 [Rhodococcus sp. B50]|nr:hypothetical protein [Rhodococcus sp. B50]MBS9375912.1 hypothetical protein [Rhodococcus sp. B50]
MFHRTRNSIEAHLTIVFTTLAVARCAQDQTSVAIAKLVEQLRSPRTSTIAIFDDVTSDTVPAAGALGEQFLGRYSMT